MSNRYSRGVDVLDTAKEASVYVLCRLLPEIRHELGLSQVELAELCAVRQGTISSWELGTFIPSRTNEATLRAVLKAQALERQALSAA